MAVDQRVLSSTPDLLFIQLLRFENFTTIKTDTVVIPKENLRLPNGERFKLVSIGDHLGPEIENGHYLASVKMGSQWGRCNDEETYLIKEHKIISSNNYVFVYRKFPEDRKFVSTFDWQEIYEGQPLPPGLHVEIDIKTGKRFAKRRNPDMKIPKGKSDSEYERYHYKVCSFCKTKVIDLDNHLEKSTSCQQSLAKSTETTREIPIKTKPLNNQKQKGDKGSQEEFSDRRKFSKKKDAKECCPNCKEKVLDLLQHFQSSLICKQTCSTVSNKSQKKNLIQKLRK